MGSHTRVPFASLAALAAVASAHSVETKEGALEAAKRDLRALPAAQGQIEAAGKPSLFKGASALPGLSLATPGPGAPSREKAADTQKPPSGGWLLDGVRGLEAESQERRAVELKRAGETAGGTTAVLNPLDGYLTQWLSPRDQSQFADGGSVAGFSAQDVIVFPEHRTGDRARENAALSLSVAPFQTELLLPPANDFAGNKRGVNPYLTDPLQPAPARTPFVVATGIPVPVSGLPAISAPLERAFPPPASLPQAKPAPADQPTTPLVDDRKYFPQLRRF